MPSGLPVDDGGATIRQAAGGASSAGSMLVRVTVASGTRRVDLVLPGLVPVAELVPEVARSVGVLDASTVYAGYHLLAPGGRILAPDTGLTLQGVEDGTLVTMVAAVDEPVHPVYDDVVEAMVDTVERDLTSDQARAAVATRRTFHGATALLLVLGAAALVSSGPSPGSALVAGGMAAVLLVGGILLARRCADLEGMVLLTWLAGGYATAAGSLGVPGLAGTADPFGWPLVAGGLAASAVALFAALGLGEDSVVVLPVGLVAVVLAAVGLLVRATGVGPAVVATVVLVLVVLAGSLLPRLALGVTSTQAPPPHLLLAADAGDAAVDAEQVLADARRAHEILRALAATVGVLLVLGAPLAVSLGPAGLALVVMACGVVMLRTRQYALASEVWVGLVSGLAGLLSAAVALVLLHPDWRPVAAVVLAAVGAVLTLATVQSDGTSVRRSRWGDAAEAGALLALLPLLVVAIGLVDAVAR